MGLKKVLTSSIGTTADSYPRRFCNYMHIIEKYPGFFAFYPKYLEFYSTLISMFKPDIHGLLFIYSSYQYSHCVHDKLLNFLRHTSSISRVIANPVLNMNFLTRRPHLLVLIIKMTCRSIRRVLPREKDTVQIDIRSTCIHFHSHSCWLST